VLHTEELGDLSFVVLCLVPWDTKLVCELDIIFIKRVEDRRSIWRGLDNADEVIQIVVKIEPTEF
jgi:hypothetical protein